ncbi:hypothetical protein UlMin_004616 [Ulmus minor]
MNTDITVLAKMEYLVVDWNPPFTKVIRNFSSLYYFYFITITDVFGTVSYLSSFMYAYLNFTGLLMGFSPNDDEVARYKKWEWN